MHTGKDGTGLHEPRTDLTRAPHRRVSSSRNFGPGRWITLRLGLVVFLMIGLAACNMTAFASGASGRDRNGLATLPGKSAQVLPAQVTHLTLRVLTRIRAGQDPAALSEVGRWQVDRKGRLDLVIRVQGHLASLLRWIRRQGGRTVAVVPWAHECEAWIPAGQVARLAQRPGVVLIQFPHYAMNRR